MTPKIKILTLLIIFFISGKIFSQDINPDRPDKTESTITLDIDKFQLETGIEYTSMKVEDFGTSKSLTAPTTLLRFGILKNVELRLSFDFSDSYFTNNNDSFPSTTPKLALTAPRFGAKVHIADGKGWVPDFSVLGSVTIPKIGSEFNKTNFLNPEFKLLFNNNISEKLDVGYNLIAAWNNELEEKEFSYSVSLGAELTPRWNSFFEVYGNFPSDDSPSNQNIDVGLSYLLKKNISIDVYGGLGLSSSSNDFILGTGISLKF